MNKVNVGFIKNAKTFNIGFELSDVDCWLVFEKSGEDQFDKLYELLYKKDKKTAMMFNIQAKQYISTGYTVCISRV